MGLASRFRLVGGRRPSGGLADGASPEYPTRPLQTGAACDITLRTVDRPEPTFSAERGKSASWKPGHSVGAYVLGRLLGSGGMAEVWMAWKNGKLGGPKVAIKRIRPDLLSSTRFVGMFCDEARTLSLLGHPNIVGLIDFAVQGGEPIMVLEYVDGVSLADLLKRSIARRVRVPLGAALFVMHELLEALGFVHETRDHRGRLLGIIHRDISPGNLLVSWAGDVKLTDFGIVHSELVEHRTSPGLLKGKLGYMSPEQIAGADIDRRSDLFAAGTLLAELLVGRPLFSGRDELEVLELMYEVQAPMLRRSTLPDGVSELVWKALARDADVRFQSAREFSEAITRAAEQAGVEPEQGALLSWMADVELLQLQSGAHSVTALRSGASPDEAARRARAVRDVRRSLELETDSDGVEADSPRRSEPLIQPSQRGLLYRVRDADSRLGPALSVAELAARFATGKLAKDAELHAGGRSLGLADVPELARLLSHSAYDFADALSARARFVKPLERARLPELLYGLARRRETGLLVVREASHQRRIYFEDGLPCFAASTVRRELLGYWLVDRGWLDGPALERALDDGLSNRRRLGEAVVSTGVLKPALVLRSLVAQLETRFTELGACTSGQLAFVAGERSEVRVPRPLRRPAELVTMLVRRGYDGDEIERLLASNGSTRVALVPEPPFDAGELGLGPQERAVLERTASPSCIDDLVRTIAREGLAQPADVRRALFIARAAGLVEFR